MTTSACPVCAVGEPVNYGSYRSQDAKLSGSTKVRCPQCELVFISPMPSEAEWNEYNNNYFSAAHGDSTDHPRARAFRSGVAKIRFEHVKDYMNQRDARVDRVLEIGPGHGEFADAWKKAWPDTDYLAVETDSSVHAKLGQLGVQLVEAIEAVEEPVDLIVVSHVLEHTLDPLGFLTALSRKLKTGGVLFVEVPCLDCDYKNIDEPHTLFFDKPAMLHLFSKIPFSNLKLGWFGKVHPHLVAQRDRGKLASIVGRVIERLVGLWHHVMPAKKLSYLLSGSERSVVASFDAQVEQNERARWLRVLAQKL